jgi:hypothetical protein
MNFGLEVATISINEDQILRTVFHGDQIHRVKSPNRDTDVEYTGKIQFRPLSKVHLPPHRF